MYFEAAIYFIFGSINLAYYLAHANGKKYIRLFSSMVLFILAGITLAGTRQPFWVIVVSLLPVLDAIVDWHSKVKRGA